MNSALKLDGADGGGGEMGIQGAGGNLWVKAPEISLKITLVMVPPSLLVALNILATAQPILAMSVPHFFSHKIPIR